ncbi:hypothetical protein HQ590_14200 [bacterium]|nr:hypothetical protein [bacterium]
MNFKSCLPLVVAALLVGGGPLVGHAQQVKQSTPDTERLEKVLKQNEQILQNQAEIKKTLDQLRRELLQLRRRSS